MAAAGLPAIASIAIGALAGGVTQILVQWRAAARAKDSAIGRSSTGSDPALRRILVLMGPGTIGLAATQVNLFVNTLLATGEGTGAASWLTLRLQADVPADRTVRRVDRHRRAAGGRASCGARRSGGGPADGGARPGTDARAERAGHDRPDRSRQCRLSGCCSSTGDFSPPTPRPWPRRFASTPSG